VTGIIELSELLKHDAVARQNENDIPIKDDTVAENWAKNEKGNRLHSLQSTRVEMASRKIQTYQNKAKNLYTIYFVFDLDGECKFIKTKHYSDQTILFLAATFL